eukprot:9498284-Pyramimonas_sp.AAC.1
MEDWTRQSARSVAGGPSLDENNTLLEGVREQFRRAVEAMELEAWGVDIHAQLLHTNQRIWEKAQEAFKKDPTRPRTT